MPTVEDARQPETLGAITYFAPDLSDPAVTRRREMLLVGGVDLTLCGFIRGDKQVPETWGAEVLGRTQDAALGKRALSVLKQLARPDRLAARLRGADAVIARNLEMLVLAWAGLAVSRRSIPLTYEVLDIHTMMLGDGLKGRAMRWIEGLLLKRVDQIIISSPGFERAYFSQFHPSAPPRRLVENKVFAPAGFDRNASAPSPGAPLRIGWFGMLRCKKSLTLLSELAAQHPGSVEVDIRGRPSPAVFGDDFEAQVAAHPGVVYHGPYRAEDLSDIYSQVHLVWGIDFYEEGLNSDWLLPNRLYEGSAHGRPLIAQSTVETGRWLAAHDAGLLLNDVKAELSKRVGQLSAAEYGRLRAATDAIPSDALVVDAAGCRGLARLILEPSRD